MFPRRAGGRALHDRESDAEMTRALAVTVASLLVAASPLAMAGGMSKDLLLSSAWCSFTYNKTTGYSHTKRVAFNANGTYGTGSRGEGYSSGGGGSMASQRNAQGGGMWAVDRGELFMSEGGGRLEPVKTVLKRNNNGYPIIVADGVEYSQCR
jgi:hypothetical protein